MHPLLVSTDIKRNEFVHNERKFLFLLSVLFSLIVSVDSIQELIMF